MSKMSKNPKKIISFIHSVVCHQRGEETEINGGYTYYNACHSRRFCRRFSPKGHCRGNARGVIFLRSSSFFSAFHGCHLLLNALSAIILGYPGTRQATELCAASQ